MVASSLEVVGLNAGYGGTPVLRDLSFSLPAGGRKAVLGRNGMGKTTLIRALMGLNRRFGGRIMLDGADIPTLSPSARALKGIGLVPQNREIFPSLTVEENLFMGLKNRGKAAIAEAYSLFPRLGERRRQLGLHLSGGEQQMLAIARALLGRPSLLLLDEPLEGLAPLIRDEVMAVLARLAGEGDITFLLVEQQLERALDFADTILLMERGEAVWQGPSAVLRSDRTLAERWLGLASAHRCP